MLKEVTIKLDVDEQQMEALKELLPKRQQYTTEEGKKPFADMTEEKLLEKLVYAGSRHMIWKKIKEEQYCQGMITAEELRDDGYLTAAQRKEAAAAAWKGRN